MSQSTFSGPMRIGTVKDGAATNLGAVVLAQTYTFTNLTPNTYTTNIILPAGFIIVNIDVTMTTGSNGTTPTFSVGNLGGTTTRYVNASTLPATATRATTVLVTANLVDTAATDTTITFTTAGAGMTTNAGVLTIQYIQR